MELPAELPAWLAPEGGDKVMLVLSVQPGARRTEIVGEFNNTLKLRLAAAPVEGKANEALCAFLAKRLGLRLRDVEMVSGATSRSKRVLLHGVAPDFVMARLGVVA